MPSPGFERRERVFASSSSASDDGISMRRCVVTGAARCVQKCWLSAPDSAASCQRGDATGVLSRRIIW
jgi:hypothetical protein